MVSYQLKVHLHLADYSPADTHQFLKVDDELSVESTYICIFQTIPHYSPVDG